MFLSIVAQSFEKLLTCHEIKVSMPNTNITKNVTVIKEASIEGKRSFLLKNILIGRTNIANKRAINTGTSTPFPTYSSSKIRVSDSKTEANLAQNGRRTRLFI